MPKTNIFLIGLMGSGKSTVGKVLAESLNKAFYDSDILIEETAQKSIAEIFTHDGEPHFRDLEQNTIETITQKNNIVLATGGGAILREKTRELLKSRGLVFYLKAEVDTLLNRGRSALAHRPLLHTANPREKLETLLKEREAFYLATANHVISTENKSELEVCAEIQKLYSIRKQPVSF